VGEVRAGFTPFTLALSALRYPPVSDELWIQYLRTKVGEAIALDRAGVEEPRPEDYVVSGLVDYNDVSYDHHADLLYDLAGQVVRHLQTYLSEEDTSKVLRCYQKDIARLVHVQMEAHYREEASGGYEARVSAGYVPLKQSAYTRVKEDQIRDYRDPPEDGTRISRYVFGGFKRCLYPVEKFESNPERQLAVILERDAVKWFRPAQNQFFIYYRSGGIQHEYKPDFVAETGDAIYMLEPKAANEMDDPEVLAKRDAAVAWCKRASDYNVVHGEKPWKYILIPHTAIAENMGLGGLAEQFGQ
jgi:type III restriction enzyme